MDHSTSDFPVHTNSLSLLKLIPIKSVMPSSHLFLCCPLLLLPSIFPSIMIFSNESVLCIRWPKYWSFSFNTSPYDEYSGLIWLVGYPCNPRASQESSPEPQFKSINSSALSFLYSPTLTFILDYWKNHRWTFVGKIIPLLFNILSRLVVSFLPRIKHLLISWQSQHLQWFWSLPKIKSVTVSTSSPSICHEVMGPDAMILVFWMLSFKSTFSLSSFTFKRLFCCSSHSAMRVVSFAYLRLLIFLPAIFIPACASSSPAFLITYSAYKLNKQGDNIQPWRTTFPIWNQSVVPCQF